MQTTQLGAYVSSYFPACDGAVKKPLPCLFAARDGAKPRIFCIFCRKKTFYFIVFGAYNWH